MNKTQKMITELRAGRRKTNGHMPLTGTLMRKEDPKDGNIRKKNAVRTG
ncbi:MAG: hypothetical protein IPP02_02940 [Chitinophagaceae bacterium]|jgi:hypothetical protein|nr:hypothetical protein [Chitinophagaceae bacterium]MBK7678960.1 hypothetical protein [Chitinophagaceae bacterium]MBK8299696.1 hypothetical protein [Chitinophagaceae bacterium]MBK9463745.1 hypothetical protein [Chitinophagaceae bacterium]MBK9659138.1 hypothetical protein [Chitinophagaceae bacterium]